MAFEWAYKPSSVANPANRRDWLAIIYLGRRLPAASSDQPEGMGRAAPSATEAVATPSYSVLLPMGFA